MRMRTCVLLSLLLGLAGAAPSESLAAAPLPLHKKRPEMPISKRFLQEFGLPTDDEGMVQVLLSHSYKDVGIPDLIGQLGDENPKKRDEAVKKLLRLEHIALPFLREACTNPDAEIARRAKLCVDKLEPRCRGYWAGALVNVLAQRRPPGTFDAFLQFLPFTNDPIVEERIYYTLEGIIQDTEGAVPNSLVTALADPLPERRAVAACILARRGDPKAKAAVARLLSDDDCNVRLRAAQGILAAGSTVPIPTLIELLACPSISIAWQAQELLHALAKDTAPASLVGHGRDASKVNAAKTAWTEWLKSRSGNSGAAKRIQPKLRVLFGSSRGAPHYSLFLDGSGKHRAEFPLPKDVHHPAIHPVIGWSRAGQATLWVDTRTLGTFDLQGHIVRKVVVWRRRLTRMLPTGTIFDGEANSIRELDPQGKRLFGIQIPEFETNYRISSSSISGDYRLCHVDCSLWDKEKITIYEISPVNGNVYSKAVFHKTPDEYDGRYHLCSLPDDTYLLQFENYEFPRRINPVTTFYDHILDHNGKVLSRSRSENVPWNFYPPPKEQGHFGGTLVDSFRVLQLGFQLP